MTRKRVRRVYPLEGAPVADTSAKAEASRVAPRPRSSLHGPHRALEQDFVQDTLADGRPFRILTVVDNWSRQSPVLEAGFRMSGARVGDTVDCMLSGEQGPRSITVDQGTEFRSRALEDWAYRRGMQLDFMRPGNPVKNAFIESCNGRLRDECLNVHQFALLDEARNIGEAWRRDSNQRPPQRLLGHLTPNEFLA